MQTSALFRALNDYHTFIIVQTSSLLRPRTVRTVGWRTEITLLAIDLVPCIIVANSIAASAVRAMKASYPSYLCVQVSRGWSRAAVARAVCAAYTEAVSGTSPARPSPFRVSVCAARTLN